MRGARGRLEELSPRTRGMAASSVRISIFEARALGALLRMTAEFVVPFET